MKSDVWYLVIGAALFIAACVVTIPPWVGPLLAEPDREPQKPPVPTILLHAPQDGDIHLTDETVWINWQVADEVCLRDVELFVDGVSVADWPLKKWYGCLQVCGWGTYVPETNGMAPGKHKIKVVVTNRSNQDATATVTVEVVP